MEKINNEFAFLSLINILDSIYLDAQQKEHARRLSSLGYSSNDIAVSLGLSPEDVGRFVRDAETVGTSVNFLIREGTVSYTHLRRFIWKT